MAWAVGMLQEAATVMHATQKIVKLGRAIGKTTVPTEQMNGCAANAGT